MSAATSMKTSTRSNNRFVFLDIFRAVAPPLVIYSHIVTIFMDDHDVTSPVVDVINAQVRDPLRLEQNMGYLAVVMFFLVSGFIITHMGTQESHREFGIKRLFRIYPLLAFTVLLSAVLGLFGLKVMTVGQRFIVEPEYVLTNILLVNYVLVPQVILLGVAWTLVVEVIFYTTVLVLLPLLRRSPTVAIIIQLSGILLILLFARELGDSFFLFAVSASYLPVVLLGQITWAVWSNRISLWSGTMLGTVAWTLYVLASIRDMGRIDDAYNSTAALGLGLFIAFLLIEPKLRPTRVISYFADRSYSFYLLHGPVSFPVMHALLGKVPFAVVVIVGLAATATASEITFRFIERPSQQRARRLTRRYRLSSRRTPTPPRPRASYLKGTHPSPPPVDDGDPWPDPRARIDQR